MYFHIYDCDIQLASVFECCQYDGGQQWQQFQPYQYSGMSGSLHYGQPRQPSVSDSFLYGIEKLHQHLISFPKDMTDRIFVIRSFGKRKMEVGAVLRSVVMRQMAEAFYYLKAQTAFHGSLKVLWQKI